MYDKNNEILKPGDFVKTVERHIYGSNIVNIAIVNSIEKSDATILINSHGMPMPFNASTLYLSRLEEKDINNKDKINLLSARELFNIIANELILV